MVPAPDAGTKGRTHMAQLTETERGLIELHLAGGVKSISEIARILGRPRQTVTNEIKSRRIDSDKGVRENNAVCVHFAGCKRTNVCGTNCGMRKHCTHCTACYTLCADFVRRTCDRLAAAPFVCNGCASERACHLPKKYYRARAAQADRVSKLRDSRSHVHVSDEQCARMNLALREGLGRGQSVHHIMVSDREAFEGVSQRSVYAYIGSECFDVGRGDLPSACSRRPRAKKARTKTKAKCRIGRTHDLFIVWKSENPGALVPEVDTIKGRVGGKVIFTIQFPCGFMLGFIKDHETAQTWTGIVNRLYNAAGPHLFAKLFPAILMDNGAPFLDPVMTENARTPHNPYKLIPRTKVFYCDPYCATQKPHVERNHVELRHVLVKGSSFDALDQDMVNTLLSHVNSSIRESIGDSTPYDEFVATYGPEAKHFLNGLGIVKIPAREVTLNPMLLGVKFQRHVEKVILRKNGVTRKSGTDNPGAER